MSETEMLKISVPNLRSVFKSQIPINQYPLLISLFFRILEKSIHSRDKRLPRIVLIFDHNVWSGFNFNCFRRANYTQCSVVDFVIACLKFWIAPLVLIYFFSTFLTWFNIDWHKTVQVPHRIVKFSEYTQVTLILRPSLEYNKNLGKLPENPKI